MKKSLRLIPSAFVLTSALVFAATQNASKPAGMNDTSAALRGYGKIHLTSSQEKGCTVWKFEATSATNASTTAGKFLADLNLSPGVTVRTLDVNGKSFSLTTVPGGAVYTGYVDGSTGYVVSAPDETTLKSALNAPPLWGHPGTSTTDLKYPPYLDRFDRHGYGFYGFGGNFQHLGNPPSEGSTDPVADMDWIQKYNFRFELWPNPGDFDDNWSVSERHTHGWLLHEAEQRGVPVSGRLYGALPHVKQFTDMRDVEQPFMEGGWYWAILGYRDYPRQSWFSKPGRLYMARQARDEVKMYADHPEIESWMMPYGEVGTYEWYTYHGDISKSAQDDWRDNVQNRLHLSLVKLSAMYGRKDHPFTSYAEVSMPEVATFEGLPGEVQDLEGEWHVKVESTPGEGTAGQWWNADVKDWDHLHMPGSVYWFKYSKGNDYLPKWVVRDFDYDAAKAGGQPVYLYDFARAIQNDSTKTAPVYLNGQKVAEPSSWGAWDVTKLLKPGANRLAIQTQTFDGRVFLSTDKPVLYPYMGADRNELWIDFNRWLEDGRYAASAEALAGIRAAEPNKPIKIMAPLLESTDQWLDMASKYGAWGHFTGEGMWAFFWYKRYGFLYGLPGTSEGAGPGNLDGQKLLYQRVFLEGLNGHDQVFDVQFITGYPELKKWFEEHIATVKQMGRYDIAGPQVIVYRSTNQATHLMPAPLPLLPGSSHEIQSVWNWDFARGTFQSVGYSGIYVDDAGISSGKIAKYPLMMDCGNEILTPEAIKNLGEWVKAGGTYVTLPFTGRSEPSAPDSWPISALTGCTVTKMRTPGPGAGTVTIAQDQPLFKELAGKSFPDDGSNKEGNGVEHNFLSTELKPGPDCQVVATYEDGTAAIVVHKLGKGRVVVLGSTFFNHIQDKKGLWLPDDQDSTFFRDLFTQLGFPSPNWTSDRLVLTQRYQTNNGLDDAVVLDNFAAADRTVDLHVVVDHKPAKVYRVAMNEVTEVPFTMDGNTVTVAQQAIPQDEVQIYYFRSHPPEDAVAHWWDYQKKLWKPIEPEKLDFSSISHGRFVDQAVDLKDDWHWTQQDTPMTGEVPASNKSQKPWVLDVYNTVGADPSKPVYAWRTFEVTPEWLKDGGITKLVAAAADGDFSTSHREFHLNGQLLSKDGFFNPDVSSLLKPGKNVLTLKLEVPTESHYIGVLGALYLTHAKPPVKTIDLAGTWAANPPGIGDARDSVGPTVQFPGKASAFLPTRTVEIPADWKDKYIVTCYEKGARGSAIGAIVNETNVIRRHDHLYGDESEVDITPYLQFGKTNTLSMLSTGGQSLDATHDWDVQVVELRLYPRSENR